MSEKAGTASVRRARGMLKCSHNSAAGGANEAPGGIYTFGRNCKATAAAVGRSTSRATTESICRKVN